MDNDQSPRIQDVILKHPQSIEATLSSLPDEILIEILSQFPSKTRQIWKKKECRATLSKIACCSSRFCAIATSLLYKTISIVSYYLIRKFSESSKLSYTYRNNIIVHSYNISFEYPRHVDYSLKQKGSWNPEAIADVLREMKTLQSVSLNYKDNFRYIDGVIKEVLLRRSTEFTLDIDLLSLDAEAVYAHYGPQIPIVEDLKDFRNIACLSLIGRYEELTSKLVLQNLLLQSAKLKTLHLVIRAGDEYGRLNPSTPNFTLPFPSLEKIAPLRDLSLRVESKDRPQLIPLSAYDFTMLQILYLQGPTMIDFLRSITGMDLKLKKLRLRNTCAASRSDEGKQIIESFLSGLSGLRTLRIEDLARRISLDCLTLHGLTLLTLRSLTLRDDIYHEDVMNPPSEPPSMAGSFSRKEINQLRDICPNIQSLTIDIEAENYKPDETFAALCKFRQLDTISLCREEPTWKRKALTDRMKSQLERWRVIEKNAVLFRELEDRVRDFLHPTHTAVDV